MILRLLLKLTALLQFTDMKPKSEVPSSERKSQDLNYPRGYLFFFLFLSVNIYYFSLTYLPLKITR